MTEQRFARPGELVSVLATQSFKMLGTDEVGHHLNVFIDAKQLVGVAPQARADRGDRVALVDGKGNDRFEPWILAEQGDVRAVKGRDHGEVPSLIVQDPLGHVGAGGVGYGVVHMQQIQVLLPDHLHHFGGEHKLIRGVVEEGVLRNPDLVIEHIGPEAPEPHGLVITINIPYETEDAESADR